MSLVFALIVCSLHATPAHATEKDSLMAQFYSSVSIRKPTKKTRVITLNDTSFTVGNPFDYELAAGITGTYGTLAFKMDYQYERQDGLHYVNQEYELKRRLKLYEVGARLRDSREDNLYVLNVYVEARLFGWVGVGVTRQYLRAWTGSPATLARFSLARNQFHVMKIYLYIRAEYEINPTRSHVLFSAEIKNFKRGRFSLVPNYQYERINPKTGGARSSYRGKIKLTINI